MGLTIHYRIKLKAAETKAGIVDAERLVTKAHAFALRLLQMGRVKRVMEISSSREMLERAIVLDRRLDYEGEWRTRIVTPVEGWVYYVNVGDGCEPLQLGLCRYPYTGPYVGSRRWAKIHSPQQAIWRLEGFCKTQYASQHGWNHFLACHRTVLELINYWRRTEAKVILCDEGGYWPRLSVEKLRRNLGEYEGLTAAFAGALKDAAGNKAGAVQAPIFKHPQFEKLEAAGLATHGETIGRAVEAVRKMVRGSDALPL